MWRLLAGRLMVVVGLVVGGLGLVGGVGVSAQTVADVAVRDRLIADQENLLNTYRCLFGVDVEVVAGGCPNPAQVSPQAAPQNPTQHDLEVRDQLIQRQETLLNTYRCRFNIDTEIVPGGCPEPEVEEEVDPPEEVEIDPDSHPCSVIKSRSKEAFLYGTLFDGKVRVDSHFCCPNALQIDYNLRCFGDKDYEYHHDDMYDGCPGGWIRSRGCPGHERYGTVKCASGALQLADGICPGDYGYGYYGYGYGTIFTPDLPYLKCTDRVIMDAYGRCPGDEFYYGEEQCPDGGSVIDYYGRCPDDDDYGMG